jgi:hypothetical protein
VGAENGTFLGAEKGTFLNTAESVNQECAGLGRDRTTHVDWVSLRLMSDAFARAGGGVARTSGGLAIHRGGRAMLSGALAMYSRRALDA